ncbi:MAG TPA: HesA/MoeB/ThiF family protein, partial [Polyangiaceae bacterium]
GKSALVIGVGGLGCPAALSLARAGLARMVLVDDDLVELVNLHRQILFYEDQVGLDKLDSARRTLDRRRATAEQRIELVRSRFLPENARELVHGVDVVIEGADNFATKFLTADAAWLEQKPVIHGAAIRWHGTAWCVAPKGRPCYRCLFEDVPPAEASMSCAEAGVMGPVTGLLGALMADLALRVILEDAPRFGSLLSYDGKLDQVREVPVPARPGCTLCGTAATIFEIEQARYLTPGCSA